MPLGSHEHQGVKDRAGSATRAGVACSDMLAGKARDKPKVGARPGLTGAVVRPHLVDLLPHGEDRVVAEPQKTGGMALQQVIASSAQTRTAGTARERLTCPGQRLVHWSAHEQALPGGACAALTGVQRQERRRGRACNV